MYLDEETVRRTLGHVAQLAPGSRIAFDYFSRQLVFGLVGRVVLFLGIKLLYGESVQFGISTRPPPRDRVAAFLEGTGLALAEHELFGKRVLLGGLVLAVNER